MYLAVLFYFFKKIYAISIRCAKGYDRGWQRFTDTASVSAVASALTAFFSFNGLRPPSHPPSTFPALPMPPLPASSVRGKTRRPDFPERFSSRVLQPRAHRFRRDLKRRPPQVGIPHGCSRIAVPQQLLHLIERMPGIDKKAGERVPQIMNADIPQPQRAPERIPEEINVGKGFFRRMTGKEPRAFHRARNGANNGHGLIRQKDIAVCRILTKEPSAGAGPAGHAPGEDGESRSCAPRSAEAAAGRTPPAGLIVQGPA